MFREVLMFLEAAVLIDLDFKPIYWHLPQGRSSTYIPDSRSFWDVIWENRENLLVIAHTHPGKGRLMPSSEDISTFRAVEAGLGQRLRWWIANADNLMELVSSKMLGWDGPDKYVYTDYLHPELGSVPQLYAPMHLGLKEHPEWLHELRKVSSDDLVLKASIC